MKKKGSVILLALFMILFVVTIIAILYLTNKRYLIIAKEQDENQKVIKAYTGEILASYLVDMISRNKGTISVYNLKRMYANRSIDVRLKTESIYRNQVTRIDVYLLNMLLYANVYHNDVLDKSIKIFNHNIWNLYVYDSSRGYVYTPREVINSFMDNRLNESEKKVLYEYKKALISYIAEVFGINPNQIQVVAKYNYSAPQIVQGSLYQASKRRVKLLIGFDISGRKYFLYSDFYLKSELDGVRISPYHTTQQIYFISSHRVRSYIDMVVRSVVKKDIFDEKEYFPYNL